MKSLRYVFVALLAVAGVVARGNPTDGTVAAGAASIAGQGSATVTVSQASNTAVINWQSFSIGAGEVTKFIQPSSSSAVLNRVLGGQTSFIDGTLSANGRVFLLNGNGLVVGPGGVINTASFTGSTRAISDSDFLAGHLHFLGGNDAGIVNRGTIGALGGDVVLIGKTVDNTGTINAIGTAGLIAGDDVLLAQKNADGSTITVNAVLKPSPAAGRTGVHNSGTITASNAELKAANGNIYALAIQNEGLVRATTLTQQGGHIYLTGDSGTVVNAGTLNASATAAHGTGGRIVVKSTAGRAIHSGKLIAQGGTGGKGGDAEVSGAQLAFTGRVDLTAPNGTTGTLLLDPASLDVIDGGAGSTTGTPPNLQNDSTSSTISPGTVESALAGANLTLAADNSLTVSNAITWTSGSVLTLSTTHTSGTGSIALDAPVNGTAGGLVIDAGQAGDPVTATAAVNVFSFILQNGAWTQNVVPNAITGASQLPAFDAPHDFEIHGGTFLRVSGGNGGNTPYQLVDVYGLQGVGGFLASNFNIGAAPNSSGVIDAGVTSNWNGGAGFVPIGSGEVPYRGAFTGGEIDNLTIDRPSSAEVGLLAVISSSGVVQNLTLNNANVTGGTEVGGIVADNFGAIDNCYVYGGTLTGTTDVGTYAGINDTTGTVNGGYSSANVVGTTNVGGVAGENAGLVTSITAYSNVTGTTAVGGLVGQNDASARIDGSSYGQSGGTVAGVSSGELSSFSVGGIAGRNDGSIANTFTYSGVAVNGSTAVGGLVGNNTGTITGSTTGASYGGNNTSNGAAVAGTFQVGGIAGVNSGLIVDTSNTGSVTGQTDVGGIAGENLTSTLLSSSQNRSTFLPQDVGGSSGGSSSGLVQTSYNSGAIGGSTAVGGIVGYNDAGSTITTVYNVGAVTGNEGSSDVGGLVGDNFGTIQDGYNSGTIGGSTNVAALIGFDEDGAGASNLYWDTSTSGTGLVATNSNNLTEDPNPAFETNLATVDSTTASSISGNGTAIEGVLQPDGYTFLGDAAIVAGTNGVYSIGTSPDSDAGGGPAWYLIEGQTRPLLATEYNYNVQNAHQLQLIDLHPSYSFNIGRSFDASGTSNASEIWGAAGFSPIGVDPASSEGAVAFTGSLYGEYNAITSLSIDRPTSDNVGLIGYADASSSLQYVILTGASITGRNHVGGLVGNNGGSVTYSQDNATQTFAQDFGNQPVFNVRGTGNTIGGLVGLNRGTLAEDLNTAGVAGGEGSQQVGGLAGLNSGRVTQSINSGAVGSGSEGETGGLVGENQGLVDDSYASDGSQVNGGSEVGGLIGRNGTGGTLETGYHSGTVSGNTVATTGALVGVNDGLARHSYWQTDNAGELSGIGTDNNGEATLDVVGYTRAQLSDARNFAQGTAPTLWDFSPQTGSGEGQTQGIWGVNVSSAYYGSPINGGLPVLQWQYPVTVKVAAPNGNLDYGATPTLTVTGTGASSLGTELSTGAPTITLDDSGNVNAGTTHEVLLSGTPLTFGYNIEYVNGTVDIVPAPLTVTANSYTLPSGSSAPTYGVAFGPFAYGETASNLGGELQFTISPLPATADGLHTITPFGLTSSNYAITFVPGTLTIGSAAVGEMQPVATFESELASTRQRFGQDPFGGLDPIYFLSLPPGVRLGGDLVGAINNTGNPSDYVYVSGTVGLPALSRLVTPDTGVVTIVDGVVVTGRPGTGKPVYLYGPTSNGLPGEAILGLRNLMSPGVYRELQQLIYGTP